MRQWELWQVLVLLAAAFVAPAQAKPPIHSPAHALPDLSRPRNFAQAMARDQALMQLGQDLFSEKALSGSGRMSCASCHDPDHGFTPANDLAVQLGGEKLD